MCHPGLVPGIYEMLKRVQHDGLGNKKNCLPGQFFYTYSKPSFRA